MKRKSKSVILSNSIKKQLGEAEWIFYDGECPICVKTTQSLTRILTPKGFKFASLHLPWVRELLGVDQDHTFEEMKVLTRDKEILGGIDAIIYICRYIWWTKGFYYLAKIPGMKRLLNYYYRLFARDRYCISGSCRIRIDH